MQKGHLVLKVFNSEVDDPCTDPGYSRSRFSAPRRMSWDLVHESGEVSRLTDTVYPWCAPGRPGGAPGGAYKKLVRKLKNTRTSTSFKV